GYRLLGRSEGADGRRDHDADWAWSSRAAAHRPRAVAPSGLSGAGGLSNPRPTQSPVRPHHRPRRPECLERKRRSAATTLSGARSALTRAHAGSLHGHALGEVARLIGVVAAQ